MREAENHRSQVSLETDSDKPELRNTAAATQQLSENDNSKSDSNAVDNNVADAWNAQARLIIVSLTWALAGLSKRK